MNNVSLIGRIATESKQNSGSVSSLLAVKRIYKSKDNTDADFVPLILFGHQGENFIKYVQKGQQIGVTGSLKTGEYVDAEGQKRYSWSVVVNHFYLLSDTHHDHQQQPAQTQQPYQSPSQQYQQPQQQPPHPQPLPKSSIIMPQSDSEQSEQWKILSKQLDAIEQEQQQQPQQPYQAPQPSAQQQNEGIPFD